jgi:pheromone shutdown protein TraB
MQPKAQRLANEMALWVWDSYKLYLYITETTTTKGEDDALQRVSSTHRDGRAFDVRIIDPISGKRVLSEDVIAKLCAYFRKKYPNLGAVSGDTRDRNLIVYRPHGSGPHLHIQIKRNA